MTGFAPLGLALIVAMQTPTAESAAETADSNAVTQDSATDESRDRRSSSGRRGRRDPADTAPRLRDTDAPAERSGRRDRDRDTDERPRRRSDSDAANDRPNLRDSDEQRERVTAIMRLKHVPANDTATTLAEWLDLESKFTNEGTATVVPVIITNSLMVTGASRQVEQIGQIVRQLDQAPAQVQIRALLINMNLREDAADLNEMGPIEGSISEVLAEMKVRGKVRVLAQSELLAGDNQPAFVQVGNRVPQVTGAENTSRGRMQSVNYENVGTMLGVTARVVDDERVILEIDVERSHLGPKHEGTALTSGEGDEVLRARQVESLSVQTTTTIRSGETAVLGGLIYKDERGRGQVLVLVEPTIVKP